MEGPLLLLKSWMLTAFLIWIYRWRFQRVAPPTPTFEAFCAERPVVGALLGIAGYEAQAAAALSASLGKRGHTVATLGGFPWSQYRLTLAVEIVSGAVLLRVTGARVLCSHERELPALATVLRGVLNELPERAEGWLHRGAFDNGLVEPPVGGWSVGRGEERRPQLVARVEPPMIPSASSQAADCSGQAAISPLALRMPVP